MPPPALTQRVGRAPLVDLRYNVLHTEEVNLDIVIWFVMRTILRGIIRINSSSTSFFCSYYFIIVGTLRIYYVVKYAIESFLQKNLS
jgi:hypothetical protein